MTGNSSSGLPEAAGGSVPHIPVLAGPVIRGLAPRSDGIYVDATFGAGGHTRAILAAADCRVIALDRDQTAIARGVELVEAAGGRLTLVEERFSALDRVVSSADGVLIDLGVSSMQLDTAQRGFSFRLDGPLDMRMGGEGPSAADVVSAASERDLARIIATLGEERHARLVARAIVKARQIAPITSTRELAQIVERVVHAKPGDIHPATRTFQALRMFVNEELEELADALLAAERILAPGGRLAVIAFHSLEDRIVKRFITARAQPASPSRHQPAPAETLPTFEMASRRPILPDEQEIAFNPRARSARLRIAERTGAPLSSIPMEGLPSLPSLTEVLRGR